MSIKCNGAVWIKKHSYEVNLLSFLLNCAFQKVTIAFLHTSIALHRGVGTGPATARPKFPEPRFKNIISLFVIRQLETLILYYS